MLSLQKYEFGMSIEEPRQVWIRGPVPASTGKSALIIPSPSSKSLLILDGFSGYHYVSRRDDEREEGVMG